MKCLGRDPEETRIIQAQGNCWGLSVSESSALKLTHYAYLLDNYDKANVIGTQGVREIVQRHVTDAVSCLLIPGLRAAKSLIDVGSGGGLPGIPLQILLPDARVDLLEATGKKAQFLVYACQRLGLSNARVINMRVEQAGKGHGYRERYDAATARALARLDVILEYCMPLLRVGGILVAMKGNLELEEVQKGEIAAELLGAELEQIIPVQMLHDRSLKRHLVVYRKVSETPREYPRRTGLPAKRPLGS